MDERKLKILGAVVDEYIVTGEPVGSKAIASKPGINVSAATIRNDMAVLEQLGFLEQPHTSAGRIPTFNGYRLYIDKLMTAKTLSDEERSKLDSFLDTSEPTEESLMENASRALAELTKCAAVVSNQSPKYSCITKVEVIPTGKRLYVLLLITSTGSIKNKVCRLEFDLSDEQLEFFTQYIQQNLSGISIDELSDERFSQLITALGAYMVTLTPLVQAVYDMSKEMMAKELTVSGESNLLSCEEFERADVVRFIEHKDELSKLLDDSFSGIQVMFSEEYDKYIIGNSSMIVSKLHRGGHEAGSLGIIGPMRLDYAKIIPYIEYLTQKISDIISEEEKGTDVSGEE